MLPPLTGSPKQIAWAESLRSAALADAWNQLPLPLPSVASVAATWRDGDVAAAEAVLARIREVADRARRRLESETSARWWIDERRHLGGYVRREVCREVTLYQLLM